MDLKTFYKCLCDEQRLRILNLLWEGPLCVCHLQSILGEGQVKMSKQLGTMRRRGLLAAHREGTWMVYALRQPVPALLGANLASLREQGAAYPFLGEDLERRREELARLCELEGGGPRGVVGGGRCCDRA